MVKRVGESMKYVKLEDAVYVIVSEGAKFVMNSDNIEPEVLADLCADMLDELRTYNVEGVDSMHYGHWEKDSKGWYYCSECGSMPPADSNKITPYCPYCGAKMERSPRIIN